MLKLREPCIHNGHVLDCKGSIGISLYPEHGTARPKLLKNADVALYAAKNSGKGHCQIFRSEMRNELSRRGAMIAFAKAALENDRILPYYQPKIELLSGRPVGFEALLRWRHPSGGVRTPAKIAAAFEDLTLAAEMSEAMIERVINDIRSWQDEGVPFGHVAINAAAAEFRRGDFADRLLERLHINGIPPEAMQVEVTETVFLGRGAEYVERALKTLNDNGVKIALDDFGTGYASLSHLKDFPVSIIKIDRSFVQELQERRDNAPIIDAVINLARSLSIRVVAEGIESPVQHEFLLLRGCDHGQGHLYSPAVPASRAIAFARRGPDMPLLIAA
jgi:EAL domain-containing protein (putative c-di-GMP-specific phosphodiesterase class I)